MFPGKFRFGAAKMAICSAVPVDRTQQVKLLDDALGPQIEMLENQFLDIFFWDDRGSRSIDHERDRSGNSDGIGYLYFAFFGKTRSNHVFCDIAHRIGSRTVHF